MDKTLKNTQKRIMNAVKDPNSQSNKNNPLMKLANILDNLDKFTKNEVFSLTEFRQEVEKQFQSADYSFKSTNRFKCILMKCTNKTDALEVIFELSVRTKVAASMVSTFSEVISISNESLEEIINSFNEIDDSIEGINDSVGKINGSIEGINDSVDKINGSIEGINDSVGKINDSIEGINDSVGKINDSIEKTEKVVDSIHYH